MSKEYGKILVIHDDTLFGSFPTEDYENCTLVFKNCTFINFKFRSRVNSIEFLEGNKFCESISLDAPKVIMKSNINTDNLERLSINGGYFKMPEGMNIRAVEDIQIASDIQSLKHNRIESMAGLTLQSSYGTTVYQDCEFKGKYGIKISALRGDLRMEGCELEVTDSNVKELEDDYINGIHISCYGNGSHMYLLNSDLKTDVLEITHPSYMVVHNANLYKVGDHGRFLSRNQEHIGQVTSHSYIESETLLDRFYKQIEIEKRNKSKILELFGSAFKKSA